MKKMISALCASVMTFMFSVTAFAGAPSFFEGTDGVINTGGDYMPVVYIAIGAGALVLIGGVVLFFTGKKK